MNGSFLNLETAPDGPNKIAKPERRAPRLVNPINGGRRAGARIAGALDLPPDYETVAGGRICIPCRSPIAIRRSMSGGDVGGGGSSRRCAGSPASAKNSSIPPGA
jgi:hypothetical protein